MSSKYEAESLNPGFCDYLTSVPASPKVIAARIAIFVFSLVLIVAMLFFTLKTIPVVSFMLFALIVFMAWFVFQFTKVEYEYTIVTGELTLSKIYGARMRKDVLEIKTSDITLITPEKYLNDINADNVLYTCKKSDINLICIVYTTKSNGKNALVISAPDKTMSCLKYYKKAVFANF